MILHPEGEALHPQPGAGFSSRCSGDGVAVPQPPWYRSERPNPTDLSQPEEVKIVAKIFLSHTALGEYARCPARVGFALELRRNRQKIRKFKDFPRLLGIRVDRLFRLMEKPTAKPRRFYYGSVESAQGTFRGLWKRDVQQALRTRTLLEEWTKEKDDQYLQAGKHCIAVYWNKYFDKPRPLTTPGEYRVRIGPDIWLEGSFDQCRPVSPEWIREWRPELLKSDGTLDDRYDPVVIWDCKTALRSYDARQWMREPTSEDEARVQFRLHHDPQATLFCYLYRRVNGKLPLAFVWYHARTGREFPTFRDGDWSELEEIIQHYLDNLNAESFPRLGVYTDACTSCDYQRVCQGERPYLVVRPELLGEELGRIEQVPHLLIQPDPQLRLKLSPMRRKKREVPEITLPTEGPVIISKPVSGADRIKLRLVRSAA